MLRNVIINNKEIDVIKCIWIESIYIYLYNNVMWNNLHLIYGYELIKI